MLLCFLLLFSVPVSPGLCISRVFTLSLTHEGGEICIHPPLLQMRKLSDLPEVSLLRNGPAPMSTGSLSIPPKLLLPLPPTPNSLQVAEMEGNKSPGQCNSQNGRGHLLHRQGQRSLRTWGPVLRRWTNVGKGGGANLLCPPPPRPLEHGSLCVS